MSEMETTVVTVTGDGRERGLSHGAQLKPVITDVIGRFAQSAGGFDEFERFLDETSFEGAIAAHVPDLGAELHGIADGAGLPYEHVLSHNLMDEHWWWTEVDGRREACSTLATATGLVGQTMDLPMHLDGSQVIVRNTGTDGRTTTVLSSAGLIGLCGASTPAVGSTEPSFAICVNALTTLSHNAHGLPVAFVLRGALSAPDAESAVEFLRSVPHASGQHYAVVGYDQWGTLRTTSLECSAGGAATVVEQSNFGHANHPLATGDIDSAMKPSESNSEARQHILDQSLTTIADLDQLTALLSDAPICLERRPGINWFTFGAIAVDTGSRTMRYSLGPPSSAGWNEIEI